MKSFIRFVCFFGLLQSARGLGPHEIALLINSRSPESLEIANVYAALRGIPEENRVYLDIPDSALAPSSQLSPAEFESAIWNPARRILEERGVAAHILAWVYSAGFPSRIATAPNHVSLHGMTFMRNEPVMSTITNVSGTFVYFPISPLFRGPNPGTFALPTASLELLRERTPGVMPLPAMSLAHTGALGLTVEESLRILKATAAADGTHPEGVFYFVHTSDVNRSKPREWQYPAAREELVALGKQAEIVTNRPPADIRILGLLTGAAEPAIEFMGVFAPGAIAEHFTSGAANFSWREQRKLTGWLRSGASSSGGTVVEPLNFWQKFPHARIFTHSARGATALESWYQALAMPQQQFIVGDPLSRPFAPALALTAEFRDRSAAPAAEPEASSETTEAPETQTPTHRAIVATLSLEDAEADFLFLLNGRVISPLIAISSVRFDDSGLPPGYHELRVVAYLRGPIRHQAFTVLPVYRPHPERAVAIRNPPEGPLDAHRPWTLDVEAAGQPFRIALLAQGREISAAETSTATLMIEPARIGAGPVVFHPVAYYGDPAEPEIVRGRPFSTTLERKNQPPEIKSVRRIQEGGRDRWLPDVSDPDGDPIEVTWFEKANLENLAETENLRVEGDRMTLRPPEKGHVVWVMPGEAAREYTAEVRLPVSSIPTLPPGYAGLVFGHESEASFGFFGLHGDSSGWAIGVGTTNTVQMRVSRGAPILPGAWYRLSVRILDSGRVEGLVDGRVVCVWDGQSERWAKGSGGVAAGTTAEFRALARSLEAEGVRPPISESPSGWMLRAADFLDATWKDLP